MTRTLRSIYESLVHENVQRIAGGGGLRSFGRTLENLKAEIPASDGSQSAQPRLQESIIGFRQQLDWLIDYIERINVLEGQHAAGDTVIPLSEIRQLSEQAITNGLQGLKLWLNQCEIESHLIVARQMSNEIK